MRQFLLILAFALLATGLAEAGVDAVPSELRSPRLFILSIGINSYSSMSGKRWQDLSGAVNDARDFSGLLSQRAAPLFDTVRVQLLLEESATRERIGKAIDSIAAMARPQDVVVFFFAGAGYHYYDSVKQTQVPYLATFGSAPQTLTTLGVSSSMLSAWLAKIEARRMWIAIDACYGSDFNHDLQSRIASRYRDYNLCGAPSVVITGPTGVTFETRDTDGASHGVFTLGLLDGLRSKTSCDESGVMFVHDLELYARARIRNVRANMNSSVFIYGSDFAIATVKDSLHPDVQAYLSDEGRRYRRACEASMTRGTEVTESEQPISTTSATPVRRALLFATDNYDDPAWPTLKNPINDARTIARDLNQLYGFDTIVVENPTRSTFLAKLRENVRSTNTGNTEDQLLVFIAGHGLYDEEIKDGFIVAREAKHGDPDRDAGYVDFPRLRAQLESTTFPHLLVVIDACFGGTFDKRLRGDTAREYKDMSNAEYYRLVMARPSRLYITSGGKEYVPDGKAGHHSPFARRFLDALRTLGNDPRYSDGILTMNEIMQAMKISPLPLSGGFGDDAPQSDFLMRARTFD